eukprot:6197597-Pleurochrysis_carterae.AAC.3
MMQGLLQKEGLEPPCFLASTAAHASCFRTVGDSAILLVEPLPQLLHAIVCCAQISDDARASEGDESGAGGGGGLGDAGGGVYRDGDDAVSAGVAPNLLEMRVTITKVAAQYSRCSAQV